METTRTSGPKRACDSCYDKKIQCDNNRPKCDWCEHHGLLCTFDRPVKGRKRLRNRNKDLHNALMQKQLCLQSFTFHIQDGLLPRNKYMQPPVINIPKAISNNQGRQPLQCLRKVTGVGSSADSSGKFHFAGHNLGRVCSYIGIPLFSTEGHEWILSKTGKPAQFPYLEAPLWESQYHALGDTTSSPWDLSLPDESITREYFTIFCQSSLRFVFPIVDTFLFSQTIENAYQDPSPYSATELAKVKACIFSFLAIASFMEGNLETTPIDSSMCAVKAQQLVPLGLLNTSLTSLQFAFMQCMYHLFSGKHQTAAKFHALACSMLFEFEAHLQAYDLDSEQPAEETEYSWRFKCHLRQYFWLCYSFDKDICLRTGHPPIIHDAHCNLTLPNAYNAGNNKMLIASGKGTPFTPGDLSISLLKSKTIRLLYSTEALSKSDAELLKDIRHLDDELESWRLSLHSEFQPKLLTGYESAPELHGTGPQIMHYIITNLEYHYLLTTIHQATSRCRAWRGGANVETEGISSSMAISLEASRLTLIYLRAAVQRMLGESYWMAVFYPMSAVLTIFCNVLLNPLHPRAKDDIAILRSASEIIKSIRIRHLTPNEVMHIKLIEAFGAELSRLAECAIQKALEDQLF